MDQSGNAEKQLFENYDALDFTTKYWDMCVTRANMEGSESYYKTLSDLFQPGKLKGVRLLDFGCGPIVQRMGFASRQFTEIVLADYSEPSRKEVEKWLRNDPDALDWGPILKVMAKVENYVDLQQGIEEISTRIRKSVKSIIHCDLLADPILPDGIGEFDAVASFFCLESCCFSEEAYKEGIKKLGRYVKKGGALVMEASLNCTYYTSHKKLKVFPLTESLIESALKEAGFTVKEWYCQPNIGINVWSNMTGSLACSAIKE